MVGGVSPGKGGTKHLGLPVFETVHEVGTRLVFCPCNDSQAVGIGSLMQQFLSCVYSRGE